MKTIITKIGLAVLLLTSCFIQANELATLSQIDDSLVITFIDAKLGDDWTIKDSRGKVLKKGNLYNKNTYSLSVELADFKNGMYLLQLDQQKVIKTLNFKVTETGVETENTTTEIIYKPLITIQNEVVCISTHSIENTSNIRIFYEGNEIFTDVQNANDVIKKSITLDKNAKGYYKIVVNVDGKYYRKGFTI